jgi:hypothetical protein
MQPNRSVRAFGFGVAEPVTHAGPGDTHLHRLDIDVGPYKGHEFRSTNASAADQQVVISSAGRNQPVFLWLQFDADVLILIEQSGIMHLQKQLGRLCPQ